MNDRSGKQSSGAAVQSDVTSKVAGAAKTGKYLTVILIAVVAAILGRGFFAEPYNVNKKGQEQIIKPAAVDADITATKLNLDISAKDYAASLPVLPVKKTIPPPPSVLPKADELAEYNAKQDEQTRLKSPTMVYNANDNKTSATDASKTQAGSDVNSNFLQQAGNAQVITVSAKQNTNTDYKIFQGKLISAVLETAVNSDLPGMVRAVISKDVYSDSGRVVLLPRGTRLIGQYNSNIAVGQTRVMVAWTRAITPEYIDIALGSPNTDSLGQSGATGDVDTHFWQIFGTSALLSVLGVAASNGNTTGSSSDVGIYGNPYQTAVAQGVLNSSNNILQSRINIQPTIRIKQGSAIQVFVARDLDFSSMAYYRKRG